jgi:hypothetical protein
MNTATWVIAGAAVVQALFAFALVLVTNHYVKLTSRLAAASEEQIRMNKTPNLVFEVRDKSWLLTNLGTHSILIDGVTVQRTSGDWSPQGTPIKLPSPGTEWFLSNWKSVIGPNGSIQLSPQTGKHGRFIYTFTFLYGSTGTVRHELAVHLNVDMSDNAIPYRQELLTAPTTNE